MSSHVTDELPLLLSGEAGHDTVLSAAAHLRTCPDCREELISAVVAHASLSSAQRFAPEVVRHDRSGVVENSEGSAELPDLSSMFASVRAEASSPVGRARAAVSSGRRRYLVGAAAAVLVVAGGATAVALAHSGGGGNDTQQVALRAFGIGRSNATASISEDGTMTVDASTLPHVSGDRYEIWLTNAARTQMQPVGWVSARGTASVTVPSDLMGTYSYIEISRQKVSSDSYAYSGQSVLRGRYTA